MTSLLQKKMQNLQKKKIQVIQIELEFIKIGQKHKVLG